jgi:predicted transcriptional regulator
MLEELQEVAKRIEALSKAEHDMLQKVHPAVEKIKESVKDVAVAVSVGDSSGNAARR